MNFEFCAPALFGLEGLIADELRFHGRLTDVRPQNGKVYFSGDERTLVWSNLWLRTAERVLLRVAAFPARTFEQLFEGVKAVPWEQYVGKESAFPAKGYSLNSALHSVPSCQSIVKKAMVERLKQAYHLTWFPETGAKVQIQFALQHDQAEIFLDTSGAGLHKRGYRAQANQAPLRETLAAGLVKLARYHGDQTLLDPFCGSGTIAIEGAMLARRQAPGLRRRFEAEQWPWIPAKLWQQGREEALDRIDHRALAPILASDIDPACVELTRANAAKAGVEADLTVRCQDATQLSLVQQEGQLIANPPYGERLLDQRQAQELLRQFGKEAVRSPLRQYYLSSDPELERCLGMCADKKRKLYNGRILCQFYQYFSPLERRVYWTDRPRPKKCKRTVKTIKNGENKRF